MKCAQFVGWLLHNNPAAFNLFIYVFIYLVISYFEKYKVSKCQCNCAYCAILPSPAIYFNCFAFGNRTQISVATQRDNT